MNRPAVTLLSLLDQEATKFVDAFMKALDESDPTGVGASAWIMQFCHQCQAMICQGVQESVIGKFALFGLGSAMAKIAERRLEDAP